MDTTNQEQETLIDQQASQGLHLEEGLFVRVARAFQKISPQFGWPILLLFLVGPEAMRGSKSESFPIYLLLGTFPVLGGLVLRFWARGFSRADGFVLDGPYRYVRNPVELGSMAAYLGFGIVLGLSMPYLTFALIVAFVFLSFTSKAYERDILIKVGGPYLRYARRVRRWIPSSLPGSNRSARTYSIFHALKFEKETLLWFILYLVVFAVRQNLFFKNPLI